MSLEKEIYITYVFIAKTMFNTLSLNHIRVYAIEKAVMYGCLELNVVYVDVEIFVDRITYNLFDKNKKFIKKVYSEVPISNNDRILVISEDYGKYLCTVKELTDLFDNYDKNKLILPNTFGPYSHEPTNVDAYDIAVWWGK